MAPTKKSTETAKMRKERVKAQFLADVELELDFLKTYPVANSQERKKAEKDRKTVNKIMRKTERQYQVSFPITDAIRVKEKRQRALQIHTYGTQS